MKPSSSGNEVVAETTLLATIANDENPPGANASRNQPAYFQVLFNERGRGVAYIAEKSGKSYVVYNGKAGRPYQSIGSMVISPDGLRIAYGAQVNDKWRMVADGKEEVVFDEVGEPVFSADSRHIAYGARSGDKWQIVLDNKMSAACPSYYDKPVFNNDSTKILYIENTEESGKVRLIVSDLLFQKQSVKTLRGGLIVTNGDNRRIAANDEKNGKQRVIEFSFAEPDAVKEGLLYDTISNLTFGPDNVSIAYAAVKGEDLFVILNGREELLTDGGMAAQPVVRQDLKGVATVMIKSRVWVHKAFYSDGIKEKEYDEAEFLSYSGDSRLYAYAARSGENWFLVVNGKEGPAFDRVVTPLFSPDSKYIIYRARKDGKRFVVVADANGKVVSQHPAYEQVFQPVFTSDGKSIAYGVKDGQKLIWKVEKL